MTKRDRKTYFWPFLSLIFRGLGWPRIEMFAGFNAIVTNSVLNIMHYSKSQANARAAFISTQTV